MTRTVEIRSYILKPGAGPRFEAAFHTRSAPMLREFGMDVVAFGRSAHDANSYYLIRAFDSLEHLQQSEDAFYGAAAWREGPREAIVSEIESSIDTVLTLSAEAVERLRSDLSE